MKTYLLTLAATCICGVVFAQSGAPPLQRGVRVQQPVTTNAVAVPNADQPDGLVVALAADGTAYVGGDPISVPALADRVRTVLSSRSDKTLYIKADARVPYAHLVELMDAVWKSGVEGLTLLTEQKDASDGRIPAPKGLKMRVVNQ
jgi:biopolymer transport protein ExbD